MSEGINIPGYRIERKLGQGGMAAVYLAIQQSFEREVALKIMSPLLNSDPSFTTRFIREARIVAHIHHASIVPVYDVGEHQPYHYLSMEYLPGGDLKQRILKGGCQPQQVVECCIALCGALDVAHRKGFIHRDIKPENILFREDGTPVLTDFGIARALDRGASLTVAGMLVGTPSYMSPEQVKGVELDGRSDLYSLGIVCYEMLTGTVPFRADSTMSVALKHLSDPMPPLPEHLLDYQPFINRLTAKDRNERYSNGSEAVQALRSIEGRTARSEATILRPLPPEVTAMLAAKAARPSRWSTAMAKMRAATGRFRESMASRWSARPHVPGARTLWGRIPKPTLTRNPVRWISAAGVLVVVAGVAIALALRDPSSSTENAAVAANVNPPAPVSVVPAATPEVTSPSTEAQIVTETPLVADAEATSETPETEAAATPEPDPAAEKERARAVLAERQKRAAARQRLEEIKKENEAIAQREQEERIQRLLANAKSAYAIGALVRPPGDNAADRYREILELRPDHPEAHAGIKKIVDILTQEARHAQAVGDVEGMRTLVADIGRILPYHQKLPELEIALADLEASPVQRTRREETALNRANNHIAKAYTYLDRKPFDQRAADMATDEYDIAAAQMPMAPGLPLLKERIIASYCDVVRGEIRNNDTKRALRMITYARKRKWMCQEFEELELSIKQTPPTTQLGSK